MKKIRAWGKDPLRPLATSPQGVRKQPSFFKACMVVVMLLLSVTVFAQEPEPKLDLIDLIRNMDRLNIALVIVLSIGGVIGKYALTARTKMKQLSELFAMAYEFTDDKVLDKKERAELIDQFLLIIGKKKAEAAQASAQPKVKERKRRQR